MTGCEPEPRVCAGCRREQDLRLPAVARRRDAVLGRTAAPGHVHAVPRTHR